MAGRPRPIKAERQASMLAFKHDQLTFLLRDVGKTKTTSCSEERLQDE